MQIAALRLAAPVAIMALVALCAWSFVGDTAILEDEDLVDVRKFFFSVSLGVALS
jgi:hypothetical protein